MIDRPTNWGKWGEEDERGTVNYITPEKVAQESGGILDGAVHDG